MIIQQSLPVLCFPTSSREKTFDILILKNKNHQKFKESHHSKVILEQKKTFANTENMKCMKNIFEEEIFSNISSFLSHISGKGNIDNN